MKWKVVIMSVLSVCLSALIFVFAAFAGTPPPEVAIQYVIRNNKTGGDCTLFGTWDNSSKTCTLTSDIKAGPVVYNKIDAILSVEGNGITINGNGHSIAGIYDYGFEKTGIYISKQNRVTVENVLIRDCAYAILMHNTDNSTITNNVVETSINAIMLGRNSSNNVITNNQMTGYISLLLQSNNNQITNNTLTGSIYFGGASINNVITDNIIGYTINIQPDSADNTIYNNSVQKF